MAQEHFKAGCFEFSMQATSWGYLSDDRDEETRIMVDYRELDDLIHVLQRARDQHKANERGHKTRRLENLIERLLSKPDRGLGGPGPFGDIDHNLSVADHARNCECADCQELRKSTGYTSKMGAKNNGKR